MALDSKLVQCLWSKNKLKDQNIVFLLMEERGV